MKLRSRYKTVEMRTSSNLVNVVRGSYTKRMKYDAGDEKQMVLSHGNCIVLSSDQQPPDAT